MTPKVDVANIDVSTELGTAFPLMFAFALNAKIRRQATSPLGQKRIRSNLCFKAATADIIRCQQPSGLVMYSTTIGSHRYSFRDLANLLAKASPLRSGDQLAGLSADTAEERIAAQLVLADLPLAAFLHEQVVPYEACEVTRLIVDKHDQKAFAPFAHLTVGEFRDWLLSDEATTSALATLAPGVMPEMAAAVSKISRLQDLMVMAERCSVITRFRNTVGLPGRLSVRLQPNHPTDDIRGIAASILDGLLLGSGDAVIGVNPATDSPERANALLCMLDEIRVKL